MRITLPNARPLVLLLALTLPAGAQAPETPPAVVADRSANEVRGEFQRMLRQQPSTVWDVLRLDPGLMRNAEFLQPYPTLVAFLDEHPEVVRNPEYFVGSGPSASSRVPEQVFIVFFFATTVGVLIWLIRTLINYRRWSRLSRIQTETHTKLLDRFTNIQDLQAYFESPAGRRFLESAPIPLEAGTPGPGAPANRILWSLQAGLVLALGGAGLHAAVPQLAEPAAADPLRLMGTIGVALGVGFILSAGAALFLSHRLGLMGPSGRQSGIG